MDKAVLVIDVPTDCFMCPCFCDETWRCCATEIDEEVHDGRPKWCPLKPLSQKQELKKGWLKDGEEILEAYINGYNACLDEILGETE